MPTPTTRTPEVSENDVLRAMFAARKEVFVDLLKWDLPVLDGRFEIDQFDTPAAHPGLEAEQRGQGPAIAESILQALSVRTPIFTVVLGEGGSGGALAIAVSDWTAMFEHAIYVICPPERCAEILWRDVQQKELAASALRVTANDLKELGVIDSVLPEPGGGAHRNPEGAAQVLTEEIDTFLVARKTNCWTRERRQARYREMGVWYEEVANARKAAD